MCGARLGKQRKVMMRDVWQKWHGEQQPRAELHHLGNMLLNASNQKKKVTCAYTPCVFFSKIRGTNQSIPAAFTSMGTTPNDCVASTTKQLRFLGLNSSNTWQGDNNNPVQPGWQLKCNCFCLYIRHKVGNWNATVFGCIYIVPVLCVFIRFKETDRV